MALMLVQLDGQLLFQVNGHGFCHQEIDYSIQ